MKAMVLAAGLGTRMRPLTDHIPKPLVQVAGRALIDHTLDWLQQVQVDEVVVNSHYKAELLEAHLASRTAPRLRVLREDVLLETGGGIAQALPHLGSEPFYNLNSDVICVDGKSSALARLREHWHEGLDALLLLHPVSKAVGYEGSGDFFVDDKGSITRRGEADAAPYVFTGVQMLHPRLFVNAPAGAFSLNVLYNEALAEQGPHSRIAAIIHEGDWLHVGDPQGREQAEAWLNARH